MRKRFSIILLGLSAMVVTLAVVSSCAKDKTPVIVVDPDPLQCADSVYFSTQIEPLFVTNCSTSGCHDAGTAASNINLDGYSNIETNAEVSLNVIRHNGPNPMPLGADKLNDSLIQQLDCWIQQGKINN